MKNIENYNHKLIEKKWQKFWKDNKTFEFKKDDRKSYYALSMFLYPSGDMHLGHLKNFSICDVNARFKRLQGFNVLHPTGADACGLPAENAAIKRGIHPADWTYQNLAKIVESMEKCGLSLDDSKTFATCDEDYQGFQQQIFIDMYKKGLVYRRESYVNWDPVDNTVLANDQVINGRGWRSDALIEKKKMTQWFVKITNYAEELLQGIKGGALNGWPEKVRLMQENWIGKSEGALVDFKIVSPSTLRGSTKATGCKLACNHEPVVCQSAEANGMSEKGQGLGVEHLYSEKTLEQAKKLRQESNLPEKILWEFLRNNQLNGLKFKRQQPIDKYIVDFACLSKKVIIEIDGKVHEIFNKEKDELREEALRKLGYRIIRFKASEVVNDTFGVLDKISEFVNKPLTHAPSPQGGKGEIVVYTTRPDTIFGASFIGLSADHPITLELAKNNKEIADFIEECKRTTVDEKTIETMEKKGVFTGLYVEHPFDNNWKLPVWIANFILMDYGTGAIFACPAHDGRDFEFAKKYDLPIKQVVEPVDNSKIELPYEEEGVAINSCFLNGLSTKEAKSKAIEKIEALRIGERKINYRLRDWCISRQRYWGCPIPMVHCDKCGVVPATDLPVKLPRDVVFDGKGSPLANHPTWKNTVCPICGEPAVRETDTMDTFMDSSWYFMRFVDLDKNRPINTELCNELLPIDQYTGGIEHATGHLIFARFLTKVMSDMGYLSKSIREPAKRLFNQGMLCHKAYKNKKGEWQYPWDIKEENGKYFNINTNEEVFCEGVIKMSKSKCNVINISGVLEDYGADACRLCVLSDTPAEKESEWTAESVEGCLKYINRIWKIVVGFVEENDIEKLKSIKPNIVNDLLKEQHKAIKDITAHLEVLEFNKAIARLREFSNTIEKFNPNNDEEKAVKFDAIVSFVRMIGPFTPHISEELNQMLHFEQTLDKKGWPQYKEALTIDSEITIAIQVNGKLRGEIKVSKDAGKEEIEKLAMNEQNVTRHLEGAVIKKVIVVPSRLVNFVI
ncbi:MAG TPA: leucine--tRNA ligase [Rickettsiales bacterium]|nr:leucine--tRNA ligase [Rickettsiales bacterium]